MTVPLAVCGLHLKGGLLNHHLTSIGATLSRATTTQNKYTMHAVSDEEGITKPALVYHPLGHANGQEIEIEVWDIPSEKFGSFFNQTIGAGLTGPPAALAFGSVHLADGSRVLGFVGEAWAADKDACAQMRLQTEDISKYGGWRAWRKATGKPL